jgi:hypothetical protein
VWILGKWEPSWKPGDLARQEGEKAGSWHWTVDEDRHNGTPQKMGDGLVTIPSHVMRRVSVIVHCVVNTAPTTITGIVFYCIIYFRKINNFVVKNHLHSFSGVWEVLSSTRSLTLKDDVYL